MANILEERKTEYFFYCYSVHRWQQNKEAQEYKEKFAFDSDNTFEFIDTHKLAV